MQKPNMTQPYMKYSDEHIPLSKYSSFAYAAALLVPTKTFTKVRISFFSLQTIKYIQIDFRTYKNKFLNAMSYTNQPGKIKNDSCLSLYAALSNYKTNPKHVN